ncbi:hypothetical protein PENSUB_6667 [Penicillium subrubescens]|uniref:Uncharacterized protein n=1 Tax=Penicillium subrubescens TaxID=1316194 RepID=A0A1Q5U0D4_9EURO|nr:hypothetical protein PENSUB_6667 [Penicillium subrubescens]
MEWKRQDFVDADRLSGVKFVRAGRAHFTWPCILLERPAMNFMILEVGPK